MSAFDELVKNQGGELAEKFARDCGTLGALITRHISEFDRTVKTFGGEIVERMGQRTQDIADTLKSYVDNFDTRLTSNGGEITASLDQRLLQFETTLGTRVAHLDTSLDSKIKSFDEVDRRPPQIARADLRYPGEVGHRNHRQPARHAVVVADRWRRAGDPLDQFAPHPAHLSLTDGTAQAIHRSTPPHPSHHLR